MLEEARFTVNEAGRQRVIRQRRKNVHAFITGKLIASVPDLTRRVRYTPYIEANFTSNNQPVLEAPFVKCIIEDGKPIILI